MTYSKKLAQLSERIESLHGVRYCTNCMSTRVVEGGKWVVYSNGLRRRWKCGACTNKEK
jgi:hypothetical protein